MMNGAAGGLAPLAMRIIAYRLICWKILQLLAVRLFLLADHHILSQHLLCAVNSTHIIQGGPARGVAKVKYETRSHLLSITRISVEHKRYLLLHKYSRKKEAFS